MRSPRERTYWRRDPRYSRSLIIVPLVPVLLVFYSYVNDAPGIVIAAGPVTALLFGLSIYTDVSYDNTAFALHLQKGVPGRADRVGRILALATFAVPVLLLLTVGSIWYLQAWPALPGMLGLSFGALLTGFGMSSVTSARWAFAVPAPGENPFRGRAGGGFSLMLTTWATWSVLALLCLPELALVIVAAVTGQQAYSWAALVVGVLLGGVLLGLGVRIGSRVLDARGPELLVQLQRQK